MSKLALLLIAALTTYIGFTGITNTKSTNDMIDQGIAIVKKDYKLEELDIGEFKKVLVYKVLPFNSKVYSIDGLGILPVMTLNVGVMNMITFNINSYDKDLPQLTIDFTETLNKRKLYVEIYDLMINKDDKKYKDFLKKIEEINKKNSNLKDFSSTPSWHDEYLSGVIKKSGNVINEKQLLNIFKDVIQAYVDYAKEAPELSDDDKDKKYDLIKGFSDKLVEKGGVAINNFKKTLGDKKTKEFLGNVLYGYLHIKE